MINRTLQTTRWLAKRLGLSVSTICRLRARDIRRLPPHLVVGRRSIRYDEATVEAWIQSELGTPEVQRPCAPLPAPVPAADRAMSRLGARVFARPRR